MDITPRTYIVPFVTTLIFIIGIIGNVTLTVIFLRHSSVRNVPNTYIFSLAVGNLLVLLLCMPFTATAYIASVYPFSELICKISACVEDLWLGVTSFTLTALSVERYVSVIDPTRGVRRVRRSPIVIALCIWAFAFLFTVPTFIFSHIVYPYGHVVCYPHPEQWPNYPHAKMFTKFLVHYAIPLCLSGSFYALTERHLLRSIPSIRGEIREQVRQLLARREVAKVVLVNVIVFAVCFLPHHVFILWFYANPIFWRALSLLAFCMYFLNACLHPIVLYCVNGEFRQHFNSYLLCWFRLDDRDGKSDADDASEIESLSSEAAATSGVQMQTLSLHRGPQLLLQSREEIMNSGQCDLHKEMECVCQITQL